MKVLVLFSVLAAASAIPLREEPPLTTFVMAVRECLDGDFFLCLKEKALSYSEKVVNARELTPVDGVTFKNTGSSRNARSYEPLATDPKIRESQVDDRIGDTFQDFLDNFVIQLRMPKSLYDDGTLEEEGRGKKAKKKLKKLLPLLALLKIKLAALIPLFLGIIAFVVVKAFLLGKIAFVAAALALLKKLLEKKQSHGWSEPVHEEHGWDGGVGGWGRASNAAQNLAYSAHAKQA